MWVTIILLSSFLCNAQAQGDLNQVVILYDASHGQQFDAYDEENGLKLIFDLVNESTRYLLRVHEEGELNATVLSDVDILMIASPDKVNLYEQNETLAIAEMLANRSSLLILGDPRIDQDSEYWIDNAMQDLGENEAINTLLDSLNITGVRFSVNRTDQHTVWEDSMFDFDHADSFCQREYQQTDERIWALVLSKGVSDGFCEDQEIANLKSAVSSQRWQYETAEKMTAQISDY